MKNSIFFLLIFCISCLSPQIATINSGCFQYVKDNVTKTINLRNDYHFTYIESFEKVDVKCSGRWKYIGKDTILLQCKDEPLENAFVQGYMPIRNHKFKVVNTNKLKLIFDDNDNKYYEFNRIDSLFQK